MKGERRLAWRVLHHWSGIAQDGRLPSATRSRAGVLLSLAPQVVSRRRGLMIDGMATLHGVGILYRSVLLPLSEDGATIDQVLGTASYRSLRSNEALSTQVRFRRLPMVPPRKAVANRRRV